MSRELYAYATSTDPVLRSDVDGAFAALGWGYMLFESLESFQKAEGPFVKSCDLIAWDEDLDVGADVRHAVDQRDIAALDRLFEEDLIGSVAIHLELPFTPDPEMLAELREERVDPTIIQRITAANVFYSVRTSAGRNDFSFEVQSMVGNLLGIALYGVIEDPQEGTFENVSREIVEGGDEELSSNADIRKQP